MLVQHSIGLQPAEFLALQPGDIHFPLDCSEALAVLLVASYPMKMKREECIFGGPCSLIVGPVMAYPPNRWLFFPFCRQTYNNAFTVAEGTMDLTWLLQLRRGDLDSRQIWFLQDTPATSARHHLKNTSVERKNKLSLGKFFFSKMIGVQHGPALGCECEEFLSGNTNWDVWNLKS